MLLILAGLLFMSLLIALATGAVAIPFKDVLATFSNAIFSSTAKVSEQSQTIVQSIRLPRALLAILVGAILALCGAATQGLFRNPLADPSLIGVTAGAAVGASLALIALSSMESIVAARSLGLPVVSLGAFVGGAITVWLVYRLATSENGTSVATMLLSGIAITALAASVTGYLEYSADNNTLRRLSVWRMGGLDGGGWPQIGMLSLILLLLCITFFRFSSALNALLLGESEARHLGVNIDVLKRTLIILVALGVASCVAVSGTIGFVGLVVPHMMRMIVGVDHRWLLPASVLAGSSLLLLADAIARSVQAPAELPVGLVTASLGAPFFIFILMRRRDYVF